MRLEKITARPVLRTKSATTIIKAVEACATTLAAQDTSAF
jgi:hypothetical protein